MLPRCIIDHNYKWFVYALFVNFDIGWVYWVVSLSVSATGDGYVLSYGQVWLPLFIFGRQVLTKTCLSRCQLYLLWYPLFV